MTPHPGKFWNGCASKPEKWPEIRSSAVTDIEHNTAMHPECLQNPAVLKDEETRMDFYLRQAVIRKDHLKEHADYIVNDGACAKKKYVDGIVNQTDPHLISKLGNDADLRYLHTGPQKGGKGRPKTFDGKVCCQNIDKSRFILCYGDDETAVCTASANSRSLKRNIRAACAENRKTGGYAILFSADTQLDEYPVYRYCKARFQTEFLLRDGKQHTGLLRCQARSENRLHFHFDTSLTSVSVAKAAYHMKDSDSERPFSMNSVKTLCFNNLFLKFFLKSQELIRHQKNNPCLQRTPKFRENRSMIFTGVLVYKSLSENSHLMISESYIFTARKSEKITELLTEYYFLIDKMISIDLIPNRYCNDPLIASKI